VTPSPIPSQHPRLVAPEWRERSFGGRSPERVFSRVAQARVLIFVRIQTRWASRFSHPSSGDCPERRPGGACFHLEVLVLFGDKGRNEPICQVKGELRQGLQLRGVPPGALWDPHRDFDHLEARYAFCAPVFSVHRFCDNDDVSVRGKTW